MTMTFSTSRSNNKNCRTRYSPSPTPCECLPQCLPQSTDARSYSRRSKSNRNLDQQKRLESSVAKYRSVSQRYDRNCKRALDDKTSRVAHIRDCYNKYNKKIIEGDGVDCCKKDVHRSPDRQRGGFRMKYRNYSSRPSNEHGSYSPPPCSKPFTKRPRKSRCNDSFEHAHNRGNAISKERRSNYADRSKSPDCFVICSNKRGSDRDQYNADANRIPNGGRREKRMDRSAERLNERVKCLCLENDNRSRNEKFVKSDEGDDKGIKKCMEQCIEKFTGLYNKKENHRSKCGDRREKSIDQTNDCNRENYRKKVSGGDSCKDLCRKKPEERTKFIDDRIRHFEESVRKLCSDQSTHKNKDQCKQRDHEEEQGEESLPHEKIEIIVTACESFSPEGENENQRQSPEDTCVCSCQSDDEDKFYTPDGCYSSEMRENNPPAEKTEGMVDYVNSYFSKDSGSRHSCNACESNKQQKRYFNKSTRIQETKEQLQKAKFDYTLNRFGSRSTLHSRSNEHLCDECTSREHRTTDESHNTISPEEHRSNAKICELLCQVKSLKHEVDVMKSSFLELKRENSFLQKHKQNAALAEVKYLMKENKWLKREFEELKMSCENDKRQFKMLLEQRYRQEQSPQQVESSCGDKSELSREYNDVMNVVTDKLQSVLKRFQSEEKQVCERSTSFTKFTNNYRTVIEEYCKNLSTRINEWFECKRRKFEKREDKLKQDYETCCTFIETEKRTIQDKVNRINEKIDQYEKYIEQQMKFIQSKYLPTDSVDCSEKQNDKTDWSLILEPQNECIVEQHDYSKSHTEVCSNRKTKSSPAGYDTNVPTETLYKRKKFQSTKNRRRTPCPLGNDKFNYHVLTDTAHSYPFRCNDYSAEEKLVGKYSILEKIKEYFDKGNKKPKQEGDKNVPVVMVESEVSMLTVLEK